MFEGKSIKLQNDGRECEEDERERGEGEGEGNVRVVPEQEKNNII